MVCVPVVSVRYLNKVCAICVHVECVPERKSGLSVSALAPSPIDDADPFDDAAAGIGGGADEQAEEGDNPAAAAAAAASPPKNEEPRRKSSLGSMKSGGKKDHKKQSLLIAPPANDTGSPVGDTNGDDD